MSLITLLQTPLFPAAAQTPNLRLLNTGSTVRNSDVIKTAKQNLTFYSFPAKEPRLG